VGEARESPPFAQARGMKDGKRVDKRREKPGNPQPTPMLCVRRMGKGWSKGGKARQSPACSHAMCTKGGKRVDKSQGKPTIRGG